MPHAGHCRCVVVRSSSSEARPHASFPVFAMSLFQRPPPKIVQVLLHQHSAGMHPPNSGLWASPTDRCWGEIESDTPIVHHKVFCMPPPS